MQEKPPDQPAFPEATGRIALLVLGGLILALAANFLFFASKPVPSQYPESAAPAYTAHDPHLERFLRIVRADRAWLGRFRSEIAEPARRQRWQQVPHLQEKVLALFEPESGLEWDPSRILGVHMAEIERIATAAHPGAAVPPHLRALLREPDITAMLEKVNDQLRRLEVHLDNRQLRNDLGLPDWQAVFARRRWGGSGFGEMMDDSASDSAALAPAAEIDRILDIRDLCLRVEADLLKLETFAEAWKDSPSWFLREWPRRYRVQPGSLREMRTHAQRLRSISEQLETMSEFAQNYAEWLNDPEFLAVETQILPEYGEIQPELLETWRTLLADFAARKQAP